MNANTLWRALVGDPLHTHQLEEEKISKTKGLAVFSSDALSSSAYATEEIVRVLVLAGGAGLALLTPITGAIVALLAIVVLSYYQTIHAYPKGGGAYSVAQENLGVMPGLAAGAALIVDYILTVAVSISAGVAAITSAVPVLAEHKVILAIVLLGSITILNLRGIRESATILAYPTYVFIAVFSSLILTGLFKVATGRLAHVVAPPPEAVSPLAFLLVARAFASGCAALTGVEAVSNGVPNFRPPSSRNASLVMIIMGGILAVFVGGVSFLTHYLGIAPSESETVVSQVARAVFGSSPAYYAVQLTTSMILLLAANTAYSGFPQLTSIMAADRFMPRQLTNLGDRLVFGNGILMLSLVSLLLLVGFGADTHRLIPLYMIGVFISFTLSQSGMVRYWLRERVGMWRLRLGVNLFGSIVTACVGTIVLVAKFWQGAWITLLAIGILYFVMRAIHSHYRSVALQLVLDQPAPPPPLTGHKVIVPVAGIHKGTLEAMRYAHALGKDVTAVYIEIEPLRTEHFKAQFSQWVPDTKLEILPSPYRSVVSPLVGYLEKLQREIGPDTAVTVILPQFMPRRWWQHALHNQTATVLRFALLYRFRGEGRIKVVAGVPFYLT